MLYLFDIDGTLIRSFMREGVADRASAYDMVEVLPGRREKLVYHAANLSTGGFGLVTNQGGVAFGYQSTGQVYRKIGQVIAAFDGFFGTPVSVHVCFEHPKAKIERWKVDSPRRKPGPGMIEEAMRAHAYESTVDVIFVGDMDTDREAAEAAGVSYVDAEEFFA